VFLDYSVFLFFRNVEDVHHLMDDVAEQHEIADELSDALSNAVGFSQDISDVGIPLSVVRVGSLFFRFVVFSDDVQR